MVACFTGRVEPKLRKAFARSIFSITCDVYTTITLGAGIQRRSRNISNRIVGDYGMARPSFGIVELPNHDERSGTMKNIAILGTDLGKNVCSLAGLNGAAAVV